jgi:hypothetical protein
MLDLLKNILTYLYLKSQNKGSRSCKYLNLNKYKSNFERTKSNNKNNNQNNPLSDLDYYIKFMNQIEKPLAHKKNFFFFFYFFSYFLSE